MLFCFLATAQKPKYQKTNFKVWGNCNMCKEKIEEVAKSIDGVKRAKWNSYSGKLKLKYDAEIINPKKVQQAIASIGYDTEEIKASDQSYNNLHYCCKYERSK